MRRFGWIGVSLVLLLALVAGGIGYSLGVSNATASAITASGANVTYVVGTGGIGFPFFPLLFGFLVFMLVVGLIRRAAWAGHRGWHEMHGGEHPGWAGPGGWGGPWGGHPMSGPRPGADGGTGAPAAAAMAPAGGASSPPSGPGTAS